MKILKSELLFQHQGEDIFLFTLKNKNGIEMSISNLGAIIQSFKVPNREGKIIDIVLGFDKMEQYLDPEYLKTMTYLGAIIGRYANRVENAEIEIDGIVYPLSANLPPHQLHGGFEGFDSKAWKILDFNSNELKMSYLSKDLEEGYPGNLLVNVSFSLSDANELIISTEASTDKTTAINLTHHDYFNLNGEGRIDDHIVQIPASKYLGQRLDYVPTGELLSVQNTLFDFNIARPVNLKWNPELGYDQSFVLDKDFGSFGKAASIYSEKSGIKMDVFTDEPTVHFYTGNHLGINSGKGGQAYTPHTGLCFETQHHCNAVNLPQFPTTLLKPDEVYQHRTEYKISIYN